MFSSREKLRKHTPEEGIGRETFIQLLVDEFYTTSDVEAQEQVTANLANFAYDPINFEFLKKAGAVKLFLELLDHVNDNLVNSAVTGLCNICLDSEVQDQLPAHLKAFQRLLDLGKSGNITANIVTIFICTDKLPAPDVASLAGTDNPILKNLLQLVSEKKLRSQCQK